MENRDRDKMNKNTGSTEVDDVKKENWENEPSRRSGNLEGDSGRTSGSDLDDIDSDLDESGSNIGSSSRGGNVGVGNDRSRNRNGEFEH